MTIKSSDKIIIFERKNVYLLLKIDNFAFGKLYNIADSFTVNFIGFNKNLKIIKINNAKYDYLTYDYLIKNYGQLIPIIKYKMNIEQIPKK